MKTRKVWYVVSAIFMLGSLAVLVTRGLNLSVDFTGGVTVEATYPAAADIEAARTAVTTAGIRDVQVQNFGTSRDVIIRMPPLAEGQSGADLRQQVETALRSVEPAVEIRRFDVVGPQVGSELLKSAIWALSLTVFLIFIYVALRFHTWRLSAGAIVGALHDPLLVLGFFALTQMTFDLSVVAAILAVIGYSLNDTVVVFDRIRERFEHNQRSAPESVLDLSINQTLSRTVMTSGTTLLVVVVLFALGGPALQGFSVSLIIGIVVGTYSSIYVASALALDLGLKGEHLFPIARKDPLDDLP
ncbi:MAG: protein translocase subunit SecF [Pseudomonadales bacterium]|nr:protein translocase subunit SecF [Pseudomonadales bacterium]